MLRESLERQRVRRSIREAEGFLELATLLDDGGGLDQYRKRELADLCIRALERIEKPGNHLAQVIYMRGQAHRLAERFQQAISEFQVAWRMVPGNIHTSLALGWCFKRIGQLSLAVDALQTAVAIDNSVGILHYNLACYLALSGQSSPSLLHLARAIELDNRFRQLAADESDFRSIRNEPDFRELANCAV